MAFESMFETIIEICKRTLPNVRVDLLRKAHDFALIAHRNDTRASGEPYFTHPLAVARILAEEIPVDDVCVACGFLHDVVEDNEEYDSSIIYSTFGAEIGVIVEGLTKIKELFKGVSTTEAENYRKLLISITKDIRVIIVKFADRLHNMREIAWLKPDKRKRIAKETLDIYAPMAHRFGLAKIKWELEDLAFKEINKNAYDEIKNKINAKRSIRESFIEKFTKPIIERLNEYGMRYDISGRPKHLYSIYRKMLKQNKPFEEIFDLFAVRVILDTEDVNECYTTLGIVNNVYMPVADRFKDYIAIPKTNNYQSIHSTVIGPDGLMVEVQIRTRIMHEISEQGVAAHWKYKEGKQDVDQRLADYVNWIREFLESSTTDEPKKSMVEQFKLDLFSEEIYVFTPQGDLKRLPEGSSPVDFAYTVHTKIGNHCIGAKVNKRMVSLDTQLHRGDQVEIITSKTQHPNKNWLKFVVTHKAKSEIRKWLNKEEEKLVEQGKELWEKKLKKLKLVFTSQDLLKLALTLKFDNARQFLKAAAAGQIDLDEILKASDPRAEKPKEPVVEFQQFAQLARGTGGELEVDGEQFKMMLAYSKCCNPIPGDPAAGYITTGDGIHIHRKTCRNLIEISKREPNKVVSIKWPQAETTKFLAGLTINGEDSAGLLNDIAHSIVSYQNTNIKSINIEAKDSLVEGTVTLFVSDLDHLSRIIERLKKIKGIFRVTRLEGN